MYLIVGLGNPEEDYGGTRHNMGFDTLNKISKEYNVSINKKSFKGLYGTGMIEGQKVILLKPQTFMNLSGESVKECIDYYKIDLDSLIVIYDDIDLDKGTIKLRKQGGAGTHNGMKSVVENLNSEKFSRVRIGIGMPENKSNLIDYVIGYVPDYEKIVLDKACETAKEAVVEIIKNGIDIAMNNYN
ncbi:MAG: aminoacyl-tRNA hydrolase [Clostridia bacterium]|nr:aminoacyl-tRNA hydrolase [Clostridia bacterium]